MPFDSKTLDELIETEKDEYRNRIPEADLTPGSDLDIEARTHAAAVFGNQAHADYLARQVLPDTAAPDYLARHAARAGLSRREATAAAGRIAIVLDGGSPPLVQADASEITTAAGREYVTTEAGTVELPTWTGKTTARGMTLSRVPILPDVSGMERGHRLTIVGAGERTIVRVLPSIQAVEVAPPFEGIVGTGVAVTAVASAFVACEASETGVSTNQAPGEEGTLASPTAGLSETIEFIEMTGGADAQTTDSLRRDVMSVTAVRPGAGNLEQWRRWTIETPGVGIDDAFIYPGLRGLGTITVLPFGASGVRQLGTERNAEILAYLAEQAAFDDDVEVLMFSYVGAPQNFTLEIRAGVGFEPDVDGEPVVLHGSTASTTTRLQLLNAADLDRYQIGDRVVVPIYVDGLEVTEEVTVTNKQNAGAGNYRLFVTALSTAPTLSESIYSGGPLYAPIVEALTAYFDELGPGDTVPPARWPASADAWEGDIRGAEIVRRIKGPRIVDRVTGIVRGIDGVIDFRVVAPAAPVGGNPGDVTTAPLYVQRLGWVRPLWE